MARKLSMVIELDLDDSVDSEEILLILKRRFGASLLANDTKELNIVAWSDKVSFLEESNRGGKFKEYLELQKSVLSTGIDMYDNDTSIPSSLGTDFSLMSVRRESINKDKKTKLKES